jgi:hypothetical protein
VVYKCVTVTASNQIQVLLKCCQCNNRSCTGILNLGVNNTVSGLHFYFNLGVSNMVSDSIFVF